MTKCVSKVGFSVQMHFRCQQKNSLFSDEEKSRSDEELKMCLYFHSWGGICPNCKLYLSNLSNVFVQIVKCICPNCNIYLSKLQNAFVRLSVLWWRGKPIRGEEELKRKMCLYFHRKHSCWIRCMDSDREIERCSILLSSWETESFRKQSHPRPPTITGLTPPDPHITAPILCTTQTHKERDPAWWGVWGININTAGCRRRRHRRQRGLRACQTCPTVSPDFCRVAQNLRK